jgi:hypothetical protein
LPIPASPRITAAAPAPDAAADHARSSCAGSASRPTSGSNPARDRHRLGGGRVLWTASGQACAQHRVKAHSVSQPGSPRVLRTHEQTKSWLEDMYGRDMTHTVKHCVLDDHGCRR